jgi:hypothetical protein
MQPGCGVQTVFMNRSCFPIVLAAARQGSRIATGCACAALLALTQLANATTYSRGFAVDSLLLPTNTTQANAYAIDLDGDGHAENALGGALLPLSNFGVDVAATAAAATSAGQIVHLVELRSSDPTFMSDAAAQATWLVGVATSAPPLFDGSDTFRYADALASDAFIAALSVGDFVSDNPATTDAPVELVLRIRLGNHEVDLPLQFARLKFSFDGTVLTSGQVNGAVLQSDIQNKFFPTLQQAFSDIVLGDPQSGNAQTILAFFDKNPTDGNVSVAEIQENSFISALFGPDIQLRNDAGDLALSWGFGFTAVQSKLEELPIFASGFELIAP